MNTPNPDLEPDDLVLRCPCCGSDKVIQIGYWQPYMVCGACGCDSKGGMGRTHNDG